MKSSISSNDETLLIVASYRGAQGKMRMFSLEIRTLEKVTSKAALRTLTSIQDGPEYEKAQIMRFQEKWNDMSDR